MSAPMRKLLVEWDDTASNSTWQTRQHVKENACTLRVKTLGFVVHEDAHKLCVAQSWSANGDVADVTSIPKGCIVRRQRL